MGAHKNPFNVMFVLAIATLALSTVANAALMQFSDRAVFESNISMVQEIDFDSLGGGIQSNPLVIKDVFDAENAAFWSTDGTGLYGYSNVFGLPGKYLAAPTRGDIQIVFGDDVSAIGLDVGVLSFDANNPVNATYRFELKHKDLPGLSSGFFNVGGGEFSFLGFVSDLGDLEFLNLIITSGTPSTPPSNLLDGTGEAIDNVTLGVAALPSTVPVPAALPLFGTGIAFLSFMNWRRRRRAA